MRISDWSSDVCSSDLNSFWLPTATGKFYPDFVAELEDGRRLVVEYKGAHIADSADTAEKRTIGQLWEQRSEGKGLFIIPERDVVGRAQRRQLIPKIGMTYARSSQPRLKNDIHNACNLLDRRYRLHQKEITTSTLRDPEPHA